MHRGILHPGLRSVRPYALDCRDFCIAMPVSYLSSDVFAVCKCLILLARWEPLTAWPVRSKHAAVAIGGVSCFAIGLLQAVGIGPTTEGEADALGYWVRFLYGASSNAEPTFAAPRKKVVPYNRPFLNTTIELCGLFGQLNSTVSIQALPPDGGVSLKMVPQPV